MNGGLKGAVLTSEFQEVLNHTVSCMKYNQIKQNGLKSDVFHFVKMKVFINDAYHLAHLHNAPIADPLKGHLRHLAAPSEAIGSIL